MGEIVPKRNRIGNRTCHPERGPYRGKKDFSILTKEHWHLPLTDAERAQLRVYHRETYRRHYKTQSESIEGKARLLYCAALKRAAKATLPFDIDEQWIHERLKAGRCEKTGIPFEYTRKKGEKNGKYSPSLDRIDQNKGYTKDNVRVTIWLYNMARNEYSDADLLEFAHILVRTQMANCEQTEAAAEATLP